uniref:Integrase, catalytic region, zinc finger, CCHC-type, peptidase aspartic, catalytic n=1 Tax=Tanacetum cinerariifolium TaxID=118510 RepID=A0A6L2L2S3_TANCI|nr:integrase, catalytic region, zinc finger, CCHC-type, peptidase aspartic, catalytic [Tanacetum cinerariifolium]
MWEAIERLQQGESLNIQDVKINLFWEFSKFTSHDGETIESYYTRFYKLMNGMPEWSRFVTIVKQQHKLDEVSYHKLFNILKQYQNEVNELRAERLARNANPLALVATAQADQDLYYQTSSALTEGNLDILLRNAESRKGLRTPHTYEEVDKQELEAHYKYIAKIQEVPTAETCTDSEPLEQVQKDAGYNVLANGLQHYEQSESVSNTCLVETNDSNVIPDSPDMCEDDIQNDQNDVESDDERVALANLIANLKLNVDENKKIQKKLKKTNTTLAQELKECKAILAKTSKSLGESISVRDSCLVALQTKQTEFEKYKAFNDRLKTKAYEISVVKQKHDELMKQSLLTKSHYEGLVKQKTKVITDLKLKEEHDFEKMLSMEKQLKFLNEIVYKRSQSIQTIHMMAPKVSTYNGRPTFANPRYLKQAQSEIPCLYAFPYDQSTHVNRLIPDREETLALERDSRSKLSKDLVRPYDHTTLNSLYEIFKPQPRNMEILIQTCLMPLAIKTQNDSFKFVHELKQEMHADVKYVESLEKEIDELESDKAEFSNMYDEILQDCVSKDVMCSYLMSLSDLDALDELQCLYLHKVKECDCLAQKLLKQTESVSKKVHTKLLQRSAKVEKHLIPFEIALQKYKEQNITISELKKLIEKSKGKYVDTKFERPSVVRQPNDQRIPKPSVLGKPAPFSNSLDGIYFPKKKSVPKANVSEGVNHNTNVSKPQLKSNQSRDKVLPNNSQVKVKKTQVEVHPRIPSVSNKMKSVTACKDSLNSRTLNANAVCATCNKCLVDSNHFSYVTKMLNDVHARTKKPNVVPISTRKPKSQANKSVTTSHKKKVASKSTNQKPQSYFRMLYENTDKAWKRLSHLNFDYINLLSKKDLVNCLPKLKYVKDQLCSSCELSKAKRSSFKSNAVLSSKGRLNLLHIDLCGPMRVASINGKKYILSKGYRVYNKRTRMIVESIHIRFDEIKEMSETSVANNTLGLIPQRQKASDYDNLDPVPQRQDVSSSADVDVPSQQELDLLFGPLYDEFFNACSNPQDKQPLKNIQSTSAPSTHTNTKDHPLEQVRVNPSRPVQTKRQLATDPEMCMYALTVSTAELENIMEAMADSAWIEAMQEKLHQFDRLQANNLPRSEFIDALLLEFIEIAVAVKLLSSSLSTL